MEQIKKDLWDTKTKTGHAQQPFTASAGTDNVLVHFYEHLHVQDKPQFG